jgi:hypothetical protein
LRPTDEADANARPNGRWLFRELDALGLDLGSHGVDILHGESEMIEPLIRRGWRAADAVSRRDRRDENVGAAKLDVDPPGAADITPPKIFSSQAAVASGSGLRK